MTFHMIILDYIEKTACSLPSVV